MSTAYELFDSRITGSVGTDGAIGLSRTFRVITDNATDDPVAVLLNGDDSVPVVAAPLGDPYPWGDFGVVAIGHAMVEHEALKTFIVDAFYGVPLVPFDAQAWDLSLQGALETELVSIDKKGKRIGMPYYIRKSQYSQIGDETSEEFDDRIQDLPNVDFGSIYTAVEDDKNGFPKQIELYRTVGIDHKLQEIERTKNVGGMTLSRIIPNFTDNMASAINANINKVNTRSFFGASAKTLKFVGVESASGTGFITTQTINNLNFDLILQFQWEREGFTPVALRHEFIDAQGNRSHIKLGSKVQVSKYHMYDTADFQSAVLDRLLPSRPPGARG